MTDTAHLPGGWATAVLSAALLAVDPHTLGGVVLRGRTGPARERWLKLLGEMLPAAAPVRRVPVHVSDDRLLGGLDIAATLRAGRRISERGILVESDGGVAVLAMAERTPDGLAARLAAVMDQAAVAVERDGIAMRVPTCFGLVALDEGLGSDERCPDVLADRLAFQVDLDSLPTRDTPGEAPSRETIAAARARLPATPIGGACIEALCGAAAELGIESLRAGSLAVRAARASAALHGRSVVSSDDVQIAGRLVLAHRAVRFPAPDDSEDQQESEGDPSVGDTSSGNGEESDAKANEADSARDRVIEAVRASLPGGLLEALQKRSSARPQARHGMGAGARQRSPERGRAIGTRLAGRQRARLNVVETLRAAAPWQRLRRAAGGSGTGRPSVEVRREDFRVTQYESKRRSLTLFIVDASGSSALHRLAEAKGAVELLLADCYVRRDRVALLAFRGRAAEVLLPPTRSLARARRSLASLPAGGGTPLAAGLNSAAELAIAALRSGETPVIVLMTDGRANVALDGTPGRAKAHEDAIAAGRKFAAIGVNGILVDTSQQPSPLARGIADAMGTRYVALPRADARGISEAARDAGSHASSPARIGPH